MRITTKQLREFHACPEQIELFEQHFGQSVTVTEALCLKHAGDFAFEWAAARLLSDSALKIYIEAIKPAWATNRKASKLAMKTYTEKIGGIKTAKLYQKAVGSAWLIYRDARASAFWKASRIS